MHRLLLLFLFASFIQNGKAQKANTTALSSIHYYITIDTNALSTVKISMQVTDMPSNFRIGFYTHPEYDDKYWRYLKSIQLSDPNARLVRKDSALWEVNNAKGNITINYSFQLPPTEDFRDGWKPFLSKNGGLIDGTHFLLFIEGQTKRPAALHLTIPGNWQTATSLKQKARNIFWAGSSLELMEAPILVGSLKKWKFKVAGVSHTVAYLEGKDPKSFNEQKLVSSIEKIVRQAQKLFNTLPYSLFYYLLQDDAGGALEHPNSITLGAPSEELKNDMSGLVSEIAHEYFHAWNLMRIQPVEYGDVSIQKQALSKSLWFSEGFTVFFADLLQKRAGLLPATYSRLNHLKELIELYYRSPGNNHLSPELVSMSAYGPQLLLGDFTASTHIQGELIATLFDLMIRNATNGRKSADDLMKRMMNEYGHGKKFTNDDIRKEVNTVCQCNTDSFFINHIKGNSPLPFNDYLQAIGYKMNVSWEESKNEKGELEADKRIYAWLDRKTNEILIGLITPESVWGKADIHSYDTLVSINAVPVKDQRTFFRLVGNVKPGEEIEMVIRNKEGIQTKKIQITGYQRPVVTITKTGALSEKQKRLQQAWLAGKP